MSAHASILVSADIFEMASMQGLWMGGNINLGYMVDDRKSLPSGIPNQNWRKYQPFEPGAEVVVKIFETFVMLGGNQRATLRYLHDNGPHFPDFDNPELLRHVPSGFSWAKPMRMLKRGGIYMVGSVALQNMMTNAVYIGHWMHKDRVVQWNNHPAIVSEELFYRAFNYLSPYTLTGEPNLDHAPPFYRERSKEDRDEAKPIYKGLISTYHEGEWRQTTACWSPCMKAYAYSTKRNDLATNQHMLWSRRCDYFDQVITEMMHNKLRETFDPKVWDNVLANTGEDFDTERRSLTTQKATVIQKMQAIITNFSYAHTPSLLQALEQDYRQYEQEEIRLQNKLAALERRA